MKAKLNRPAAVAAAFTLVELLVATTILLLLMLVIFSTLDQTGRLWKSTTQKVETFQGARAAFEALTRNLSQATLNTFWKAEIDPATSAPRRYARISNLHFMLGRAGDTKLLGTPTIHPTQAVFFQAPIGYTAKPNYEGLDDLLTACGYFIEYGDDLTLPIHVKNPPGGAQREKRMRFRLYEMLQPTEELRAYEFNPQATPAPPNADPKKWEWISKPLADPVTRPARSLAENVIALVLVPKLSKHDKGGGGGGGNDDLDFPNYTYDSRDQDNQKSLHQLPPIVQVTLVAIDETSAIRTHGNTPTPTKTWTEGRFETASTEGEVTRDLYEKVIPDLQKDGINYRVFSTDVIIRGSKWSQQK